MSCEHVTIASLTFVICRMVVIALEHVPSQLLCYETGNCTACTHSTVHGNGCNVTYEPTAHACAAVVLYRSAYAYAHANVFREYVMNMLRMYAPLATARHACND